MRILDRYLIKEMVVTWIAVTLVLLVIMIGNVLARGLSKVTDGAISADVLLVLVAVQSISLLVTLIPLGLYLGILLAHGRFYRDNEMTVMQATGSGWMDLLRPTALVGLLGVVLIATLTIFASPWAARYEQLIKKDFQEKSAISLITPGKFIESSDGSTVLFVKSISGDKSQFNDVFMHRKQEKTPPVIDTARIASYQVDNNTGNEYLIFSDGQTSIGQPGDADYAVTEFKRQGVLRPKTELAEPRLQRRSKTLKQLMASDDLVDLAEVQWRISIPLAALLLALLAVPLSYTSPREGRFGKIAIAILIYIPYANLLVLARKWIANGSISPWVGLWPVHIAVLILVAYLLIKRVGWSWFRHGRNVSA